MGPHRVRSLAATVVLLVMAASAGAAPHALYYVGVDDSWGRTLEDDGVVAHAPGTPLDGIENRVVANGARPGDGSTFLDARIANRAGDIHFYAGQLAAEVTGRPNLLFPGSVEAVAWYGEWRDQDIDNVILDIRDAEGDPQDEFVWRGRSSGDAVDMRYYVHPRVVGSFWRVNVLHLYGLAYWDDYHRAERFQDFTDADEPHYYGAGLSGAGRWNTHPLTDASFLVSLTMVTHADALVAAGTPLGYDLFVVEARVDVDRYESLSADVEALYVATGKVARPIVDDVRGILLALDAQAFDTVNQGTGTVNRAAGDPAGTAHRLRAPPYPREPNHVLDDFNGNAVYGGVGDVAGSHNTYPGYATSYHFFVDARAAINARATIDVGTPLGVGVHQPLTTVYQAERLSPTLPGSGRPHDRQATAVFGVTGTFRSWHDVSGDGFIGGVCDTADPEAWDAERNTCRNYETSHAYSEWGGGDKGVGLCANTEKLSVLVQPVDGPWPLAFVVRNYEYYSQSVWSTPPKVLTGMESVELEWGPCDSAVSARTRDILVFPGGSPTVAIMTTVTATGPEWQDENGFLHPPETVTDVDVYHPVHPLL